MRPSEKWLIAQTLLVLVFSSWAFGGRIAWAPPWIMGICALAVVPLTLRALEGGRLRRTEDGGRKTEDGGRGTGDGGRKPEGGRRRTDDGRPSSVLRPPGVPKSVLRPPSSVLQESSNPSSALRKTSRPPSPVSSRRLAAAWLLPWLLLVAAVVTSLLNPSYRIVELPDGSAELVLQEFVTWLPATSEAGRTTAKGLLWAGFLLQGIAVYWVMRSRRAIRTLLSLLCLNALVLAIVGTFFWVAGADQILGFKNAPRHYFFATFVYKNHWAAFALITLGVAAGLFWREAARRGMRRSRNSPLPFYLSALALVALTIPLPESRSGTALLIVFLVIFSGRGLIWLWGGTTGRRRGIAVSTALVLCIGFLGYTWWLGQPALVDGVDRTERQWTAYQEHDRLEVRGYILQDVWEMAQVRPLWGWGFGTFALIYPVYQSDDVRGRLIDAHTDWLQFLSELGFAGFALLLATPLLVYIRYLARGRANPLTRWSLAGCALILILAIAEFPFQNPAVAISWIVVFAAATKYGMLRGREASGA